MSAGGLYEMNVENLGIVSNQSDIATLSMIYKSFKQIFYFILYTCGVLNNIVSLLTFFPSLCPYAKLC